MHSIPFLDESPSRSRYVPERGVHERATDAGRVRHHLT